MKILPKKKGELWNCISNESTFQGLIDSSPLQKLIPGKKSLFWKLSVPHLSRKRRSDSKLSHHLKAVRICVSNALFLVGAGTVCQALLCLPGCGFQRGTRGDTVRATEKWPWLSFSAQLQRVQEQSWTCFPYNTGSAELLVFILPNLLRFLMPEGLAF